MNPVASPQQRGLITVSIMLATIMQALDTTIANVALPHMQGTMSATEDQISWVLTSYIVAAAIMTPMTGFLAGRLGPQTPVPVLGGRLYPHLAALRHRRHAGRNGAVPLVAGRLWRRPGAAVPGRSAGHLPKEKHGSAMAMWGVGVMVGPILGPTLGGYLTESFNWRWVFFINLPVGILSLLGILAFVPETVRDKRRFDLFGFALLSLAIGALQLFLDRGQSQDWFSLHRDHR